jgi:hypothetical protein
VISLNRRSQSQTTNEKPAGAVTATAPHP